MRVHEIYQSYPVSSRLNECKELYARFNHIKDTLGASENMKIASLLDQLETAIETFDDNKADSLRSELERIFDNHNTASAHMQSGMY